MCMVSVNVGIDYHVVALMCFLEHINNLSLSSVCGFGKGNNEKKNLILSCIDVFIPL